MNFFFRKMPKKIQILGFDRFTKTVAVWSNVALKNYQLLPNNINDVRKTFVAAEIWYTAA